MTRACQECHVQTLSLKCVQCMELASSSCGPDLLKPGYIKNQVAATNVKSKQKIGTHVLSSQSHTSAASEHLRLICTEARSPLTINFKSASAQGIM